MDSLLAAGESLPAAVMLLAILLLAALTEALVEYFLAPWIKPEGKELSAEVKLRRQMILRYSAAVVGVGLSLVYATDLLAMIGLSARLPFVGEVATGLLVGRGSNFINDFIDRWVRPAIKGESK